MQPQTSASAEDKLEPSGRDHCDLGGSQGCKCCGLSLARATSAEFKTYYGDAAVYEQSTAGNKH
jgi:hypothetical protein